MLVVFAAILIQAAPSPSPTSAPPRPSIITNPDWARKPTGEDMEKFYPKAAAAANLEGRAAIHCLVTAAGDLSDCTVINEDPPGAGFGQAALNLGTVFKMKPMMRDGVPISGAQINIPIHFMLPKPSAPPPAPTSADLAANAIDCPPDPSVMRFYPRLAQVTNVEGDAVVNCEAVAGRLQKCVVLKEVPADTGFGRAAILMARCVFKPKPELTGRLDIPIHFKLPSN